MNISINLSPEIEGYLHSKIVAGFYSDESGVIMDAISRMKLEDDKIFALKSAVKIGDEQLQNGGGIIYTPERLEKITEMAFAGLASGKKVNSDVKP